MVVTAPRFTIAACYTVLDVPDSTREPVVLEGLTKKAYEIAVNLFTQVQSYGISTLEDVIPCTVLYKLYPAQLESLFVKHGERFLRYLEMCVRVNLVREVVYKRALQIFGKLDAATVSLSIVKEKVALCDEISGLAYLLALKLGMEVRLVRLRDVRDKLAHTLLFIGCDKKSFDKWDNFYESLPVLFLEALDELEGVVVFDPYLKMIVPAKLAKTETRFVDSLSAMDALFLGRYTIPKESDRLSNLGAFERAEAIEHDLRDNSLLSEITLYELGLDTKPTQNFVVKKRCQQIQTFLDELFSDTKGMWRYKRPTRAEPKHVIAVEINLRERAQEIAAKLKGLSLNSSCFLLKERYWVEIIVEDFGLQSILEKIASSIAPQSRLDLILSQVYLSSVSKEMALLTQQTHEFAVGLLSNIHARKVSTLEDIISSKEESFLLDLPDFKALFLKYGERFLKYSESYVKLQLVRGAIQKTFNEFSSGLGFVAADLHIATTEEGVGNSLDLSYLACFLAARSSMETRIVQLKSLQGAYSHSLVLIGGNEKLFNGLDFEPDSLPSVFLEMLKYLEGVVVIDPYFNIIVNAESAKENACFVQNLQSRGAILYQESKNPSKLFSSKTPVNIAIVRRYIKDNGLLSHACFKSLPFLESHVLNFQDFIVEKRFEQICSRLDMLFPDLKEAWKYKQPTQKKLDHAIWAMVSSRSRAIEIASIIKNLSIDVLWGPVKESFCVQIKVPDFGLSTILEKLMACAIKASVARATAST